MNIDNTYIYKYKVNYTCTLQVFSILFHILYNSLSNLKNENFINVFVIFKVNTIYMFLQIKILKYIIIYKSCFLYDVA